MKEIYSYAADGICFVGLISLVLLWAVVLPAGALV
jgi:hypothetical protein